jgi:hypothetical protein
MPNQAQAKMDVRVISQLENEILNEEASVDMKGRPPAASPVLTLVAATQVRQGSAVFEFNLIFVGLQNKGRKCHQLFYRPFYFSWSTMCV